MKATVLYRIASVLLCVAVIGNTFWLVYFWHSPGPVGLVHFQFGHRPLNYAQVVLALEVFCSLCVLFAAYLSWYLGTLARTNPQAIGAIGWTLVAYQAVATFVTLFYFSGFVFMISAAIAICTAWATALVSNALSVAQISRNPN